MKKGIVEKCGVAWILLVRTSCLLKDLKFTLDLHNECNAQEDCNCNIQFINEDHHQAHLKEHSMYKKMINYKLPIILYTYFYACHQSMKFFKSNYDDYIFYLVEALKTILHTTKNDILFFKVFEPLCDRFF